MRARRLTFCGATAALWLAHAGALAQAPLGRLFSTPQERAALEAARPGGPVTPLTPAAPAAAGGTAAVSGPQQEPTGTIPGLRGASGAMPAPALEPGPVAGAVAMPAVAGGSAETPALPDTSTLTLNGILRSSDQRAVVWLNGLPQRGMGGQLSQQPAAASPDVTVMLPSGKKIILKAGQRYDLNLGLIRDINEQ